MFPSTLSRSYLVCRDLSAFFKKPVRLFTTIQCQLCLSSNKILRFHYSLWNSIFKKAIVPVLLRQKSSSRKTSSKRKSYNKYEKDEDSEEEDTSDDSDDSDDEDGDFKAKGVDVKTLSVQSLRIDALLKKAFGINRSKVEVEFYNGKIWRNGKLLLKKSDSAKKGDEIDMIIDTSKEDTGNLRVRRLEILKIEKDDDQVGNLLVKLRKTKSLLIDNYEGYQKMIKQDEAT